MVIGFRVLSANLKFDIVFLDPPYHKSLCNKALELISRCLTDNAIIICETQNDEELPDKIKDIELVKEYCYSAIKLTLYRKIPSLGDE